MATRDHLIPNSRLQGQFMQLLATAALSSACTVLLMLAALNTSGVAVVQGPASAAAGKPVGLRRLLVGAGTHMELLGHLPCPLLRWCVAHVHRRPTRPARTAHTGCQPTEGPDGQGVPCCVALKERCKGPHRPHLCQSAAATPLNQACSLHEDNHAAMHALLPCSILRGSQPGLTPSLLGAPLTAWWSMASSSIREASALNPSPCQVCFPNSHPRPLGGEYHYLFIYLFIYSGVLTV